MSTDTPANPADTNSTAADAPAAAPPESAPAAPAPAEAAPPAAAASTTDAAHDDGAEGDDAEGGAEEGEATEAGAAEGAEGKPKKRRRRRRKKKPAGAEGAAPAAAEGAEGAAPAEGGDKPEGGEPRRERREKKEREEREPPPFKLGDVVFGKVLEVTEDVLMIDLSGKAKAIFDLRELLIAEDEEEGPDDDEHEHDHDDKAEAGEAAPAEGAGEAAPAADASPDAAARAVAEAVSAVAEAMTEAVAVAVADAVISASGAAAESAPAAPAADAPAAEASPEAPAEAAPAADAPKDPKLPRVILEPGAPFVGVVHNDGARGGCVVLTHHPKRVKRAKPVVAAAFRDKTLVWGIVTGVIKGGVEVDVEGLRGFAPASHMDLRMGAQLHPLVGKRLAFAVTTYAKRGRDVVLSRRAMLEADAKAHREEALAKLQMGSVVDGVVRTVVQFGAFVDVGGVEGLVPLSEMSHNRADQPKDVFKVGETVKVKILRVDEKGKLWLSRRQGIPDPWGDVAQKYALGTKHKGTIARIQPFGAFVELESGIDGLIHTADLSFKRIEKPEDVVKVGDEMEVVVAHLDASHHRIGLHPALTGDLANEQPQKVAPHKMVKCVVVQIDPNGLQVRIMGATGRHARGFITAAATGTPRGTDLRKSFPVGKEMDAKVVEIDPRRGEVKLSVKAFNEENERSAYQQYRAQVKREAKFGTFADLLQKTLKKDG